MYNTNKKTKYDIIFCSWIGAKVSFNVNFKLSLICSLNDAFQRRVQTDSDSENVNQIRIKIKSFFAISLLKIAQTVKLTVGNQKKFASEMIRSQVHAKSLHASLNRTLRWSFHLQWTEWSLSATEKVIFAKIFCF